MQPAIRLLALSLCLVGTVHADTPKPKPVPPKDPLAGAKMLAPIQVDSLTLTPLVASATAPPTTGKGDILVLDEAMASKKVRIQEQADESVNQLTFINKSEQPVFILAGEVIIGGKQDRIIGANTIVPANTTQTVPVFCVEHGRWDNSSKQFTTANALAHGRLRGKASFEAQGDVWNEVAAKNEKRKATSSTDTYRNVAEQQKSDGSLKAWQKKVDDALAKVPVADRTRMVGYVVALNGKVATIDMFQSPAIFKKLEPKLLKSYVTEAVDVSATKEAKPPSEKQVFDFIADAESADEEASYQTKAAATLRKSGKTAGKAKVMMSDQPAAAAPVYQTYQAH